MCFTFAKDPDGISFLFQILCGVLQGCPLSAMLFNLSLNPFLRYFEHLLHPSPHSGFRACADDIGVYLESIELLWQFKKVFWAIKRVSGLCLGIPKCVIIPLTDGEWEPLSLSIKGWLSVNIPEWVDFQITRSAEYLGMMMGPNAGSKQWDKVIDKFDDRVKLVAAAGGSNDFSIKTYNKQIVPLFGYKAQCCPLPKYVKAKESSAIHKITHMPPNTFPYAALFAWTQFQGTTPVNLFALTQATLMRTAWTTFPGWRDLCDLLAAAILACGTVAELSADNLSPAFWDSPAFVSTLRHADAGFPKDSFWKTATSEALNSFPQGFALDPQFKLQKAFISSFSVAVSSRFANLLVDRLPNIFPSDWIAAMGDQPMRLAHFQLILALLCRVRNNEAMATIRFFLNGVCTSHRMHAPTEYYCRFGCFGPACLDDLPHYLHCPIVDEILFEIESADLRPIPHFPSPLHRSLWRWQLSHPSLRGIIKIAAFVKSFHACRSLPELKHKPITKSFTRALRDNLRENVMRK
jgi:hypothetical protein